MKFDIKQFTEKYGRVAAFVDGYNLYDTTRGMFARGRYGNEGWARLKSLAHWVGDERRARYCWYRLDKIVACGLGLADGDDDAAMESALDELAKSGSLYINFYTSPPFNEFTQALNPKYNQEYYELWTQLQKNLGVKVVTGYFDTREHKEKYSDVNLAIDMICGAYEDAYDTAVVVSCDRDFEPAVDRINSGKKKIRAVWARVGETSQKDNPLIYNLSPETFLRHCLEADKVRFEHGRSEAVEIHRDKRVKFDDGDACLRRERIARKLRRFPKPKSL